MKGPLSIRVLIRNQNGEYLTGSGIEWEFTRDRKRARVFDYFRDRVSEQLQFASSIHGAVWTAVRLDPWETYEVCDRCGSLLMASKTFFDGKLFLCPDCRATAKLSSGHEDPPKDSGPEAHGFPVSG